MGTQVTSLHKDDKRVNQSAIFHIKSISRNTTHPPSQNILCFNEILGLRICNVTLNRSTIKILPIDLLNFHLCGVLE